MNLRLTIVVASALVASLLLPQQSDAAELKVMSFNIRYGTARDGDNHWSKRKEFVVETIAKYAPDLLGTQETLDFQKVYLAKNLKQYTSIGVGRDSCGKKGEMTAIYYRSNRFKEIKHGHFWLSETPDKPGSKSWDTSLTRMCSWIKLQDMKNAGRPILFMNTHFDHRGKVAREKAAELIRQKATKLGQDCDIILTGDFNAAFQSKPYKALFGETESKVIDLVDTYRASTPDNEPGEGTFSGFQANRVRGARIDWIAVSKGWSIKEAAINRTSKGGRTPSDHFPVTTTLTKRPQAKKQ